MHGNTKNETYNHCFNFLIATPSYAFDPWSKEDVALEAAFLTVDFLDWGQTRYIAKHPDKFHEHNLVLGRHPEVQKVDMYFLSTALLHIGIVTVLPQKYRKYFQGVTIGLSTGCVINNKAKGIGINFSF
jgi:hypothetical protein